MDGITHINVYSKGATELGRLLSNFAHTPFTGGNHHFESVEGWWHWYCTGKKYDHLKALYGYRAKQEGRKYEHVDTPTRETLIIVYRYKIEYNSHLKSLLIQSSLPFTHYYVYVNKKVETDWEWTGSIWNEVRTDFQTIEEMIK